MYCQFAFSCLKLSKVYIIQKGVGFQLLFSKKQTRSTNEMSLKIKSRKLNEENTEQYV